MTGSTVTAEAICPDTAGAAAAWLERRFAAAGIASARLDARLLVAGALGWPRERLAAEPGTPLDADAATRIEAFARRRLAREPVSRILGAREFWSLDFAITPATLDPRPDSETLIEAALRRIPDRAAALRVIDLGTGSGCLLLALLSELPNATGLGVDRDPAAAAVARANAENLGLGARARFIAGDWGAAVASGFDCLLSNPPYIESRALASLPPEVRYDPRSALDGGIDGLDGVRAVALAATRLLAPGGLALIEIGAGQAEAAGGICRQAGLMVAAFDRDLAGIARCLVAKVKAP